MIDINRVKMEEVKNPERFKDSLDFLDSAIKFATDKVYEVMGDFVYKYPTACSVDLMYKQACNGSDILGTDWTQGFWTGMLWISYELTGNELCRAVAEAQFDDYKKRCDEYIALNHHDIGFIYIPSILAQYKITGSKKAKELCLKAADLLANRYSEGAKIIQVRDWNEQGNFIVDCCMNIPLLYWATRETGDRSYFTKALNHITQVVNYVIRDDASTYQCFKIDEVTGEPVKGWQGQGYDDDSCWARGQAWVIYGLALSYKYTMENAFLEMAKRTANYFLNRLPSDNICNWDLVFTDDAVQRDSSAAPITACGLLEIAKYLDDADIYKKLYVSAATDMLMNLDKSYATKNEKSNGLLKHGVYCKADAKRLRGLGDDECCIWGDYFYMEGLIRLKKDWEIYW